VDGVDLVDTVDFTESPCSAFVHRVHRVHFVHYVPPDLCGTICFGFPHLAAVRPIIRSVVVPRRILSFRTALRR